MIYLGVYLVLSLAVSKFLLDNVKLSHETRESLENEFWFYFVVWLCVAIVWVPYFAADLVSRWLETEKRRWW